MPPRTEKAARHRRWGRSAAVALVGAGALASGVALAATDGSAAPATSHRPILIVGPAASDTSGLRLLLTRCSRATGCSLYSRIHGVTKPLHIRYFVLDDDAQE